MIYAWMILSNFLIHLIDNKKLLLVFDYETDDLHVPILVLISRLILAIWY